MPEIESVHVLVIEDDDDTRANLADILALDHHHVECAASIAEARRRAHWSKLAIILLDRKLPDGNAEDLLPELRKLAPAAEVLIVTGYRDLEGALACLHQGAADYILKPINPEALRANLRRVAKARQTEQQLRLLATAVRDVKEGILITDGELDLPGPQIVFVNDALTQISGYSAKELLGRTPRIFQCGRTDRVLLERLKDHLRRGLSYNCELINRRKDGTDYYVDLHVSPVFDPSGRVTNFVATQRDVTARKQADERVLQAQRLAAIGEMVTGLAHESRNALQRSMACLEILVTELQQQPDNLDLVHRVQKAQQHLHRLYEEVRNYAAPITLRRENVNIDEVWRDAWSQLDVLRKGRQVRLQEAVNGHDPRLEIDSFAIGQVFRNIFENAIVACPDPCEIVVQADVSHLNGCPALRISVLDNGPGMDAEQAKRMFDPFFTTKTKGTGLGMAIARRIVEAHGGEIGVESSRENGAKILVTLPYRAPP